MKKKRFYSFSMENSFKRGYFPYEFNFEVQKFIFKSQDYNLRPPKDIFDSFIRCEFNQKPLN